MQTLINSFIIFHTIWSMNSRGMKLRLQILMAPIRIVSRWIGIDLAESQIWFSDECVWETSKKPNKWRRGHVFRCPEGTPSLQIDLIFSFIWYRVSSHQTSSVSSNRRKVKPSGLASDDRLSFGTDGSLGTGEENTNGVTLSSILLLGRCHSVSLAKQPSPWS
jgi:hypothetical protein